MDSVVKFPLCLDPAITEYNVRLITTAGLCVNPSQGLRLYVPLSDSGAIKEYHQCVLESVTALSGGDEQCDYRCRNTGLLLVRCHQSAAPCKLCSIIAF